jgi:hypothetical protein
MVYSAVYRLESDKWCVESCLRSDGEREREQIGTERVRE